MADHPNIVRLHEVYSDKNYVHLVTEYCDGGELLGELKKRKLLDEKTSANYFS